MSDSIEERVLHARHLARLITVAATSASSDDCGYDAEDILESIAAVAVEIDTALFPIADAPGPILNWAPDETERSSYKQLATRVRRSARQEVGAR